MMAPYLPPPRRAPGARSRGVTGDHVQELFGRHVPSSRSRSTTRPLTLPSGEDYWELFSNSYGPTKSASSRHSSRSAARSSIAAWVEFGDARREGDQMVHHREYLLTLGTRR